MTSATMQQRMDRLWASQTAQVSFAGDDPVETRPSFMGAVHDFLTENKAGVAIRRVFFAGMASLALSSAMAAPTNYDLHAPSNNRTQFSTLHDDYDTKINTDGLFADKEKFNDVFNELASGTGLKLISGDVNNQESFQNFADQLVANGVHTGYDIANHLINNDNANSPVVVQFFSGVDANDNLNKIAAISYDGYSNAILKDVFSSFESINFGEDVNSVVEKATWIHETMHVLIKNAEQTGLESWKAALSGDYQVYDDWRSSVQYQLSHPELKDLIDKEINVIKNFSGGEYDAGSFIQSFRSFQGTDDYTLYHENMADGFMSAKFLQDGYSISEGISDSRSARADKDPLHDSSVGQNAISDQLTQESLKGKNANELASITAKTVQTAMGYDTDSWSPLDNNVNDGLKKLVGGEKNLPKPPAPEQASSTLKIGTLGTRENIKPPVFETHIPDRVQHSAFTVLSKQNDSHEHIIQSPRPLIKPGDTVRINSSAPPTAASTKSSYRPSPSLGSFFSKSSFAVNQAPKKESTYMPTPSLASFFGKNSFAASNVSNNDSAAQNTASNTASKTKPNRPKPM